MQLNIKIKHRRNEIALSFTDSHFTEFPDVWDRVTLDLYRAAERFCDLNIKLSSYFISLPRF